MKCFVYRNLHKEGCVYSIKALEGEFKGRIIGYATGVSLFDCTFKVSAAGRARVLREKKKNVHAGVEGLLFWAHGYERRLCDNPAQSYPVKQCRVNNSVRVTYNPYLYETFVDKREQLPVQTADRVHIDGKELIARGFTRP